MLRTAAEVFCKRHTPAFQAEFEKPAKGTWRDAGARRNELAHGITSEYGPAMDGSGKTIGRYYLVPTAMDSAKRPLGASPNTATWRPTWSTMPTSSMGWCQTSCVSCMRSGASR